MSHDKRGEFTECDRYFRFSKSEVRDEILPSSEFRWEKKLSSVLFSFLRLWRKCKSTWGKSRRSLSKQLSQSSNLWDSRILKMQWNVDLHKNSGTDYKFWIISLTDCGLLDAIFFKLSCGSGSADSGLNLRGLADLATPIYPPLCDDGDDMILTNLYNASDSSTNNWQESFRFRLKEFLLVRPTGWMCASSRSILANATPSCRSWMNDHFNSQSTSCTPIGMDMVMRFTQAYQRKHLQTETLITFPTMSLKALALWHLPSDDLSKYKRKVNQRNCILSQYIDKDGSAIFRSLISIYYGFNLEHLQTVMS